jgi:predicted nucleic acid-binding protein
VKTPTSSADRSTGGREEGRCTWSTPTSTATRESTRANPGVRHFFRDAAAEGIPLFLSAVTIGELRKGVETVRHRGDLAQSTRLSRWLGTITRDYADAILPCDDEIAQIWGKLRVPHAENPLDEQIAATGLMYGPTVVTRNVPHYEPTGVAILNPSREPRRS